jgi:4-amino-4-deoxy-L-arabinose transferase-like glycosyltransferase
MKKSDLAPSGLITAVFIAALLFVGRLPSVPLDDSWNFVLPLKHFMATGVPVFDSFNSAAAVLHLVFSAPFVFIFGLDFQNTVAFNLLVTWLTLIAIYALGRQAGASKTTSTFAALVYFAAPPVFVTAFTFQSDPIFILFEVLALIGFVRYVIRQDVRSLIFASGIAALSIWGKMHGALIAPAVLAALSLSNNPRRKTPLGHYFIIGLPTFISLAAFKLAKPLIHPVSATLDRKFAESLERLFSPEVWLKDGSFRIDIACVTVCFYLLPWIISSIKFRPDGEESRPKPKILLPLGLVVATLTWFFVIAARLQSKPWAMISSVLTEPPTMEPMSLFGYLYLGTLIALPLWIFWSLNLRPKIFQDQNTSVFRLGLFIFLFQLLALVPIKLFMDRYFLTLLPPAILMTLILPRLSRPRTWLFSILIIAFFALNIARVRQYRNGCEAQWQAADALVSEGFDSLEIDGGYAWVGWNNYEKCRDMPKSAEAPSLSPWVLELCPRMRPKWKVTFYPPGMDDDFVISRQLLYDAGRLLGKRPVYALKKSGVSPSVKQ